ncbi:hypothetical protein BKA81DRAFT_61935 [Phyllosticta paracitricarpa]
MAWTRSVQSSYSIPRVLLGAEELGVCQGGRKLHVDWRAKGPARKTKVDRRGQDRTRQDKTGQDKLHAFRLGPAVVSLELRLISAGHLP